MDSENEEGAAEQGFRCLDCHEQHNTTRQHESGTQGRIESHHGRSATKKRRNCCTITTHLSGGDGEDDEDDAVEVGG